MLPLFVALKNDGRSCEIIDPSLNYSCSSIFQLSSDPISIDFFKDGWLLISVGSKRMLKYFNPFSRVSWDFPTVGISNFSCIGFSTYPTSTDCVTVAIAYYHNAIVIYHIKYGDELWDSFEFPINDNDDGLRFFFGTNSPIYLAGTFYVLDKIGNLGAFTLVDGKGSWRVYKRPYIWHSDYSRAYLVKSDGELYFVFIHGFVGDRIEVFKFNLLEENCSEVKSLGNHSFFLSYASSFSVEITEAGMQNRIYLSRLKGNSILFYSLETGKYHVLGSEETMEDIFGTQEPLRCCWL
ncbi:F-box protein At4g00893-like [Chenopodium quinoa]|uniref:F-box protein At4g00893-like n=1 Tax=Chenopodium quinoa TaxID=63459 RepID=UPI000B788FBF|nr:F-box protein At4g00893-like [Chenopodium quinoa]